LNLRLALTMGACAMVTCVGGTLALAHHDTTRLKCCFGVFLLAIFGWRVLQEWKVSASPAIPPNEAAKPADKKAQRVDVQKVLWSVVMTGLVLGLSEGLFSTCGAIFMAFALATQAGKDETRATFMFLVIVILSPVRLLVLYFVGVVEVQAVGVRGLIALPGGMLGLAIGNYITQFLSDAAWRQSVLVVLLCSSAAFMMAPSLSG